MGNPNLFRTLKKIIFFVSLKIRYVIYELIPISPTFQRISQILRQKPLAEIFF